MKPIRPEEAAEMLTVDQVARHLGMKPRTVVDHVVRGKLHPIKWQRPGVSGGPISLFDRHEVQALLEERAAAKTELVPAGDPGPLVRSTPQLSYPAVRDQAAPVVPIERKRYLNLAEASAYTGLGKGYIQEQLKGESKGPRRSIVYLREDLDKL